MVRYIARLCFRQVQPIMKPVVISYTLFRLLYLMITWCAICLIPAPMPFLLRVTFAPYLSEHHLFLMHMAHRLLFLLNPAAGMWCTRGRPVTSASLSPPPTAPPPSTGPLSASRKLRPRKMLLCMNWMTWGLIWTTPALAARISSGRARCGALQLFVMFFCDAFLGISCSYSIPYVLLFVPSFYRPSITEPCSVVPSRMCSLHVCMSSECMSFYVV